MELYTAVKENENKSLTGKWIEFMITVSEIRQTERKNIEYFLSCANTV